MIYLRWLFFTLADYLLLLTVPFAAVVIAAFTRAQSHDLLLYTWGGWYGTYDNPPQGDEGFVAKRGMFPGVITGFKGYVNRVHWMLRNPLYGLARKMALPWNARYRIGYSGNPDISDKEKRPGYYFARVYDWDRVVGFEFYCVLPWGFGRCIRARLGWKVMTDKFERYGFAQFVDTFNPFDGYGDDK